MLAGENSSFTAFFESGRRTLLPGFNARIAYKRLCLAFHKRFLSSVSLVQTNSSPLFDPAISANVDYD